MKRNTCGRITEALRPGLLLQAQRAR